MAELSDEMFQRLVVATQEADRLFVDGRSDGRGAQHWLRDCFLPALEAHGLTIADERERKSLYVEMTR